MTNFSREYGLAIAPSGIELYVHKVTGAVCASQRMLARLVEKDPSTVGRWAGGAEITKKIAEVPTPGGIQGGALYDEDAIYKAFERWKPDLLIQCAKAGIRVYLHGLAGYSYEAKAAAAEVEPAPAPQTSPLLPGTEQRLKTVELGMRLLNDLGGADDRTRLALKDVVRNILLEDRLQPALPAAADTPQRLEWSISDRVTHLDLRAKCSDLAKIGKAAAQLYRKERNSEPPKREQYVGGTTRMVNCYGSADLEILDKAIKQILE
ncbi:MAG: hypothetical protein AAF773_27010 [Cyanobacteria bacterium P01_D01_bin.115]